MIRSTFPVRSPLPNRQPSTRSAPAISPSSAVATAVPRSLCGWTERIAPSRCEKLPDEPLHPVRVDVRREGLDGRRQVDDHLLVRRRPPLVRHGLADLERVFELRVVEALGRVLEDDLRAGLRSELLAELRTADGELGDPGRGRGGTRRAAVSRTSSCRGGRSHAAAPSIASYVRSISSGLACVRTAIVVSAGIRLSSTSTRQKSKSALEAAGKPTSISFTPSRTRRSKKRRFRAASMGLTSAWFPSRRSVEHQVGARSRTTSGHVRSGRSTVA